MLLRLSGMGAAKTPGRQDAKFFQEMLVVLSLL